MDREIFIRNGRRFILWRWSACDDQPELFLLEIGTIRDAVSLGYFDSRLEAMAYIDTHYPDA